METRRKIADKKMRMREEFEELIKENNTFFIADLYKASASLLNEIRRRQDEFGYIVKGGKNTIFGAALEEANPKAYEKVKDQLTGPNIFIFSNENPFKLALEVSRLEVDLPASAGDTATSDIIIREGNTGFPPGPIISLFSAARIPTKIISGSVYVTRDTLVASRGDVISSSLANILGKLGRRPIKAKLKFKSAYDLEADMFIPADLLVVNLERYEEELLEAVNKAMKIGLEIAYPTRELLPHIVLKACSQAKKLALEASYVTSETIPDLLMKGQNNAIILQRELDSLGA
ncbi:MAG: 50S ribosomal protein L10 [Candidatus Geothermarchaeales archaeon]